MVIKGAEAYGHSVDPQVVEIFTKYRKTHNQGVYDVYTPEMRKAKKAGIITGTSRRIRQRKNNWRLQKGCTLWR